MKDINVMGFLYHFSRFNVVVREGGEVAIYNSFSGSLAVLSLNEYTFLERLVNNQVHLSELDECLSDLISRCLLDNFIVRDGADELAVLEQRLLAAKGNTSSLTVTILPTLSCNFACPYCFEGVDKHSVLMPEYVQDFFIDWLDKHSGSLSRLNVTWFGGEPTLGLPVMERMTKRMMELCAKNNISYNAAIVTNGSLLDLQMAKNLYRLKVSHIQITLDGPEELHDKVRYFRKNGCGSYSAILRNVKRYQNETPISTVFRINVDSNNEEHCFRLIDDLAVRLHGVKNTSIYFAPIHASTEMCKHISQFTLDAMHYAELETRLTEYSVSKGLMHESLPSMYMGVCAAAKSNGLVLSPNGDVHKCWETVTMNQYRIGNITDSSFDLYLSAKDWTDWSPFKEQLCLDCRILPNCMGMCTYRFRFKENYSGNSAKNPCPSLKYNIEDKLIQYLKKYDYHERIKKD